MMTRREAIVAGVALAAGCATTGPRPKTPFPALFVSHGSPMLALADDEYTRALRAFGASIAPKAILVLSAHRLEDTPLRVSAWERATTIYDFTNFPKALYEIEYACPGDQTLAAEIAERLRESGFETVVDQDRGLDHGAWVPLRIAYPEAKTPVVEVSFPPETPPRDLVRIGRAMAPLREREVLLVGSGGMVHNLFAPGEPEKFAEPYDWAREFDAWVVKRVEAGDVKSLLGWKSAPHADKAHPSTEHFDPIFFVMGALGSGDRATHVYDRIHHGHGGMRTFALMAEG